MELILLCLAVCVCGCAYFWLRVVKVGDGDVITWLLVREYMLQCVQSDLSCTVTSRTNSVSD